MDSFRELLEADAFESINEEFIRFHGKEWYNQQELLTGDVGYRRHYFLDGVLKVTIGIEFVLGTLADIGYVERPRGFFVKTNGKKWANEPVLDGNHIGFVSSDDELILFLAKNCGPAWVNQKDKSGRNMGFFCNPAIIPKLALIGGPDFVNCVDEWTGKHIQFFAKKDDLPLLAEISGKGDAWINQENHDWRT